jgi:hypothetical protein
LCRFRWAICRNCSMPGHIKRVCFRPNRNFSDRSL